MVDRRGWGRGKDRRFLYHSGVSDPSMLPNATLPCSLADLFSVFRPCFTAPTFRTFIGLVVGLIGYCNSPPNSVRDAHRGRPGAVLASQPRAPLLRCRPLVGRDGGIGVDRPQRDPPLAGRVAVDRRGRRHAVQACGCQERRHTSRYLLILVEQSTESVAPPDACCRAGRSL